MYKCIKYIIWPNETEAIEATEAKRTAFSTRGQGEAVVAIVVVVAACIV